MIERNVSQKLMSTGFRNNKRFFKIIFRLSTSLKFTHYKKLRFHNTFQLVQLVQVNMSWKICVTKIQSNSGQDMYHVYHKVTSSSMSQLVAHFQIFRRLMKGKFDAYVLRPLAKKFQNWIADQSTAPDFMVFITALKHFFY